MSQPCRWNCMNGAFMLYGQADRDRGRAGPGSPEPARTHQHRKPRNRETPERSGSGVSLRSAERDPGSVGDEAKPRGQAGVVEGTDEVVASFAEVGPAVVVGRDDLGRPEDRGRGGRPDRM